MKDSGFCRLLPRVYGAGVQAPAGSFDHVSGRVIPRSSLPQPVARVSTLKLFGVEKCSDTASLVIFSKKLKLETRIFPPPQQPSSLWWNIPSRTRGLDGTHRPTPCTVPDDHEHPKLLLLTTGEHRCIRTWCHRAVKTTHATRNYKNL